MEFFAALCGSALILIVLWDGFETIVLPRRVTRTVRLTRLFYRTTWRCYAFVVNRLCPARRRDNLFSYYGPLSLILLLVIWAGSLIFGYALLYWAAGSPVGGPDQASGFDTDLYLSGTTFFTLGIGDVVPQTRLTRVLTVIEAGMGFGFLALTISYIPSLLQPFGVREANISLLDARAGSPPSVSEMLRRHHDDQGLEEIRDLLAEWERWSAELLESHLSYPVLAYLRSQHDNQSWLGALTFVLDTCAFVMTSLPGACARQAELTFAIARHTVVDLAIVFQSPPVNPQQDRLPGDMLGRLRGIARQTGFDVAGASESDEKVNELRALYEPYVTSLATRLCINLPPWVRQTDTPDNWQVTAWDSYRSRAKHGDRHGHF